MRMYIVAIGWLYVTVLVALNEPTVVSAIISFLFCGLLLRFQACLFFGQLLCCAPVFLFCGLRLRFQARFFLGKLLRGTAVFLFEGFALRFQSRFFLG